MRSLALLVAILSMSQAHAENPLPKPEQIWPAGPLEVRATFAAPLDPADAAALVGRSIPYFAAIPLAEKSVSLGQLRIGGAKLEEGGKLLRLATDPHPRQAWYDLRPALRVVDGPFVGYSLQGAEIAYHEGDVNAAPAWSGWVPEMSTAVFDAHLSKNPTLAARMKRGGMLSLRGAVTLPAGKLQMNAAAAHPFVVTVDGEEFKDTAALNGWNHAWIPVESTGAAVDVAATITLPLLRERTPTFAALWTREIAGKSRPVTPTVLLPWAPPSMPITADIPKPSFDLAGGDPKAGEAVFLSEAAKCATCHAVGGKGGNIGPNLDHLKSRDRADIYHQIAEPSAVILPDYVTYTVSKKDGSVAVGVVRAEGFDAIRVSDIGAQAVLIPKSEIEDLRASAASTMPVGLAGAIGEARMRDLLAYLTR